jgi:thiamine pyrophosphate-dependent acetolactate synthase large subunit-like protein
MSLGMLATIANLAPANLVIAVLDNEVYGETGGQATATAGQSDLVAIARGAGIQSTVSVTKDSDLAALRQIIHSGDALHFANIKIVAEKLPLVFPYSFDGVTAVNRFREAATA